MKTTVQKWGNSLAIRIPRNMSDDTNISEGSSINLLLENGKIIISKAETELSLKDLLNNITDENVHSEIVTGDSIGGEIW